VHQDLQSLNPALDEIDDLPLGGFLSNVYTDCDKVPMDGDTGPEECASGGATFVPAVNPMTRSDTKHFIDIFVYSELKKDACVTQSNIDKVTEGIIKKAAFKYGVKRPTLMNRLKHAHCGSIGRPTILTRDEEVVIVHAAQKLGDWGFGIDRDVVARVVQDVIKSDNRTSPFKNGKPGHD